MAGESRALIIARGARRRGAPRDMVRTTDAHFLWRIKASAQRLRKLVDLQERGARTADTVQELTHLEYRIEKMLNDAQRVLIEAALSEEKTACDG